MADVNSINKDKLISAVERIERLEEEKKGLASDVKDIFAGLKAEGFNVAMIKKAMAAKNMDQEKRKMEESEFELYLEALGVI